MRRLRNLAPAYRSDATLSPVVPGRGAPLARRRLLAGCAAGLAATLTGCVPKAEVAAPAAPGRVYFPALPEEPRYVFEFTLRSSDDVQIETEADRLRGILSGWVREQQRFVKPYAVAARGGRVYVTDTVARRVHAFDVPRRRYFQFGFRREGRLAKPLGIDTDAAGRVYVADATASRVVVFDPLGLFLAQAGTADDFDHLADVAVDASGTRVYAVDLGGIDSRRHRVLAFDGQGRALFSIGERGAGEGQFNLPSAAAVAPDGTLFVLDAGNFRVQAFDAGGRYLHTFGGLGRGFGQFARPKAIATDAAGLVYVADASFGNVQVFDGRGSLLLAIGNASRSDGPGRYALLSGVAGDERGFLYLLDQVFNKVDVLRTLPEAERRLLVRSA